MNPRHFLLFYNVRKDNAFTLIKPQLKVKKQKTRKKN